MSLCPCRSHQLVRQISRQRLYWFCLSCRQEMPNFSYLNSVDKGLNPMLGESKNRSPQKTLSNKSLNVSDQILNRTSNSTFAFCSL